MEGTVRCAANSVALTPISFLERSAVVYSDNPSLVYGHLGSTWKQTLHRCKSLASSLVQLGVSYGHVVAAFLPNIPAMYELHFGVPMAGAVLCPLNIRHDSSMVSVLLRHSEAHWGETPCAFVHLKDGSSVSASELIGFCRDRLPHYMVPTSVVFDELPKTSTGKTQKFVLKERARVMGTLSKGGRSSKL